ncbi:thioredoxin-like protein, partial [Syncephalis plumigaleata]
MDSSEKLVQFCSITEAEPDQAEKFLAIADGDLERAITLFMENGPSFVNNAQASHNDDPFYHPQASPSRNSPSPPPVGPTEEDFNASERLAQQLAAENELDELNNPATSNQHYYSSILQSNSPFGSVASGSANHHRGVFSQQSRPWTDVHSEKENRLAELFRPPYDIISRIDLAAARAKAKQEKKKIMVNYQDLTNFACQTLNRDIWSNKNVKEFITDNFIFLQYTTDEPYGQEYQITYKVQQFPHVAIIDPRTGASKHVWTSVTDPDTFMSEAYAYLYDDSDVTPSASSRTAPANQGIDMLSMTDEERLALAIAASRSEHHLEDSDMETEEITNDNDKTGDTTSTNKGKAPADEGISSYTEPLLPEPDTAPDTTRVQFRFPG